MRIGGLPVPMIFSRGGGEARESWIGWIRIILERWADDRLAWREDGINSREGILETFLGERHLNCGFIRSGPGGKNKDG
jgi:hypothetical protein